MRWVSWAAMFAMGCLQSASSDAGLDASVVIERRDASYPIPPPQEYDPCVWDGLGEDVCVAESWVFDGTSCRSACGPRPQFGRPGVFETEAACKATCPCNPEKFIDRPFAAAGLCDEIFAYTDGGAPEVAGALSCRDELVGSHQDQVCRMGGAHPRQRALSIACRASVQPQVHAVGCYVGE